MGKTPPVKPAAKSLWLPSSVTASSVIIAFLVTAATLERFHEHGQFSLLVLSPCLLAAGWFCALLGVRASIRSHWALAVTAALLAVATCSSYLPAWTEGGSCMGGMALLAFLPLIVGFPVVYLICWVMGGAIRQARAELR